ncbi:MAG: hypothetical protein PHE86_04980 [Candidatus Marinimicrobia bacterium]|nr:hypothetical protein [Candidatus Neomarinimicrobiota bacterium]
MTHYIVHWRDIVGDEFIDTFKSIVKFILVAEQKSLSDDAINSGLLKNYTIEQIELYRSKIRQMKKCGYYFDSMKIIKELGWFRPYLNHQGKVKFMTTASPDSRKYIQHEQYQKFIDFGN